MIAAWMLHAILVAAMLSAAGVLLERAPAALGVARRWVWSAAIAGSIGLPLVAWLGVGASTASDPLLLPAGAARAVRSALAPLTVSGVAGTGREVPGIDAALLAAWALSSLVLLALFARAHGALARERRRWEVTTPESLGTDAPVRLTDEFGPAVIGLRHAEIVLPRWCLDLPAAERDLVLAHEAEHLRSGDVRLLLAARLAVVMVPWLLPLWWQLHRLRLAVEIDCDGRVLRRGADPSRYGNLLLEVGRRRSASLPAVALAEPASHLERRIRAMTESTPRRRWLRAGAALAAGLALVAVACESPTPAEDDAEPTRSTVSAAESPRDPAAIVERSKDWVAGADEESGDAAPEAPATATYEARETWEAEYVPRDEEPVLLNRADVVTKMSARLAEVREEHSDVEVTVQVYMFVDEAGRVSEARVSKSSGIPSVDEAALQAARSASFRPATADGEPVGVWIRLPFQFTTEKAPAGS